MRWLHSARSGDSGRREKPGHPHAHVIETVVLGLRLPSAAVAAPRRRKLEHVEWVDVDDVGVAALQQAVQPPLVDVGIEVAITLGTRPHQRVTRVAFTLGLRQPTSPTYSARRANRPASE